MTITDWLLLALIVLAMARLAQAERHHRRLTRWLDALGDATSDMLRAILDTLRGNGQ